MRDPLKSLNVPSPTFSNENELLTDSAVVAARMANSAIASDSGVDVVAVVPLDIDVAANVTPVLATTSSGSALSIPDHSEAPACLVLPGNPVDVSVADSPAPAIL
jgi:hypothetical protein